MAELTMDNAITFYVGECQLSNLTEITPVYIETVKGGWGVSTIGTGYNMVFCLHQTEHGWKWKYKDGTLFKSKERALNAFNEWLEGNKEE